MTSDLISVIVTAGSDVPAIERALRSLQTQTYENWEAFCVAPSLDGSVASAVDRLSLDDRRIRLLQVPGPFAVQAARNTAIRAARGEWIAFLDPDDSLLPCSLEARVEIANQHDVPVVHSAGYEDADGVTDELRPLAGWVYRDLLEAGGPRWSGLMARKSAVGRIDYLDETLTSFHAWDTAIRLARHYPFGFEAMPTFVSHPSGAGSPSADRTGRGYEQVLRKHFVTFLWHAGPRVLARHYRAAATRYHRTGETGAATRCRAIGWMLSSLDPRAIVEASGLPFAAARRRAGPTFRQRAHVDSADMSDRLSQLLNERITVHSSQFQDGQSGSVHLIRFRDAAGRSRAVVLKKVEDAFDYQFYKEVLEPFQLDSPEMYGHVQTTGGRFLVMEYIPHDPEGPRDSARYLRAAQWLAKKDAIVHRNFDTFSKAALLRFAADHPPFTDCLEDCIGIITMGVDRRVSPLLSPSFLRWLESRKASLAGMAANIFRHGRLTICHRDFHLKNVLFPAGDGTDVYVIDWSSPVIDSVCIDLARLVHTAPRAIRADIVAAYRSQIDVDGFDELYRQAELLVSLAEFSWMFSVVLHRRKDGMSAAELRRARKLQNEIVTHPFLAAR